MTCARWKSARLFRAKGLMRALATERSLGKCTLGLVPNEAVLSASKVHEA